MKRPWNNLKKYGEAARGLMLGVRVEDLDDDVDLNPDVDWCI